MHMFNRPWTLGCATLLLLAGGLLPGCVQRTMTLTSDPAGALVYLNGQEMGRTPLTRDFVWYGTYDVQIRKEGYVTLNKPTRVIAPWWQWVPFDLVAELMPWRPKDHQTFHYHLEPQPAETDSQTLIDHANEMRKLLPPAPATSPSSQPASMPASMPAPTDATPPAAPASATPEQAPVDHQPSEVTPASVPATEPMELNK